MTTGAPGRIALDPWVGVALGQSPRHADPTHSESPPSRLRGRAR